MNKRTILIILTSGVILLTLLGTALIVSSGSANQQNNANGLMNTANTLYAQERYDEAAHLYEQIAASGLESRDLFFNLGNAYYLQGETGRSILNYERAAQLAPRDADVSANLATARALVEGQIVGATPQDNPLETVAATSADWMTFDELTIALLIVWFVFGGAVLVYRQISAENRSRAFKTVVVSMGLFVVLFSGAYISQLVVDGQHTTAVVVMEAVDISVGPGANYETMFSLHGGAEVYIQSQRGDWVQLTLPGTDVSGWVPALAVEAV